MVHRTRVRRRKLNKSVKNTANSVKTTTNSVKNAKATSANFHGMVSNKQKSHIVKTFLEILNAIKLFHWKTKSYSQHRSTDELYEKLSVQIDRFIEVLMGKTQKRIDMVEHKMKLYDFDDEEVFQHKLFEFRQFLMDLSTIFHPKRDSDLFTIRDDMLESVNQFLYMITLSE
jgi:hypothetical protein